MRAFFALLLAFVAPLGVLRGEAQATPQQDCSRIISLAPSLTEVIYALDLQEQLVGVSRYSDFPPEARSKPRVGALLDPNYEAIVALKPTLVLGLSEFREKLPYLESLGLKTLTYEHRSLAGISDSIRQIGAACGRELAANKVAQDIMARVERVKARVRDLPKIRTMVVVGESSGDGNLTSLFLSGTDGFYNEVLTLAGGENVVKSKTLGVSTVSAEGVIVLNPELIIEIVLANGGPGLDHAAVRKSWSDVQGVSAVKNNKVFIVDQDYVSIPGPRFVKVLEDFAGYLHPEA